LPTLVRGACCVPGAPCCSCISCKCPDGSWSHQVRGSRRRWAALRSAAVSPAPPTTTARRRMLVSRATRLVAITTSESHPACSGFALSESCHPRASSKLARCTLWLRFSSRLILFVCQQVLSLLPARQGASEQHACMREPGVLAPLLRALSAYAPGRGRGPDVE